MITNNNRIEGKKPLGLMLPPQLKTVGTAKTKGQPLEATYNHSISVTCHACGEKGHYKSQCARANNNAHGRAYLLRDKNAHQDPNIVTGLRDLTVISKDFTFTTRVAKIEVIKNWTSPTTPHRDTMEIRYQLGKANVVSRCLKPM
ncbi:putative reverse transcriptase domain-containing protein [Tanacetum coccineum]|uniref:Reverse transcriptase domain-containing protein n=1 Tax=Tanacetum coccineum TaxID=301880 RepID=A0ABQ4ZZB5_9ASTR